MTVQEWGRVKELFEAAQARPPQERPAFLAEACQGSTALRHEVESLLAEYDRAGDFLSKPVLDGDRLSSQGDTTTETASCPKPGPWIGMKVKDRYLVQRELGRGGVGVVYLAHDEQLHSRPVVIKVLLEQSRQSDWFQKKFRQEREALARIDHPGVVGVLDAGETPDGKSFLVLQFVDGVTLRSVITTEGMDLARVAQIVRQIGHALTIAHNRGVCHRDLKPENVMVEDLGEGEELVKIIDFGIATVKDSLSTSRAELTRVAGSVNYMAPEQLMGVPEPASDTYSLGVIAYEMICGRRPFAPASSAHLHFLQKQGVAVRPADLRPDLPVAAENSILKALAFDPKDRYLRARDFGEELARGLVMPPPRESQPEAGAAGGRRSPVVEIAHVLAIEILDLAASPVERQCELLDWLQRTIRAFQGFSQSDTVSFVTGAVILAAFLRNPESAVRCACEAARAARARPGVRLRMALHTGPVYRIWDVDGKDIVAGDGLGVARELMMCGDDGHILVAKSTAEMLWQLSAWRDHLHDAGEHEFKSIGRIRVFSLSTGNVGNPEAPRAFRARPARAPASAPEPNLGSMVAKMCNRRAQEDEFKRLFLRNVEGRAAMAQAFILHGDEGECHQSMVQRLLYQLELFAERRHGERRGGVAFKNIPWQYEGALAERKARLLFWLFEQFAPAGGVTLGDLSPAVFRGLLAASLNACVAVQHEIRATRWDRATGTLMREYLEFWAETAAGGPQPVIFFNIIYPIEARQPIWGIPLLRRHALLKRRIRAELERVCQASGGCCSMLDELRPVTRDDVLEWFSIHNICDSEDVRLRASERIFPVGDRRVARKSLAEVEPCLREIHREFLTERGYL